MMEYTSDQDVDKRAAHLEKACYEYTTDPGKDRLFAEFLVALDRLAESVIQVVRGGAFDGFLKRAKLATLRCLCDCCQEPNCIPGVEALLALGEVDARLRFSLEHARIAETKVRLAVHNAVQVTKEDGEVVNVKIDQLLLSLDMVSSHAVA